MKTAISIPNNVFLAAERVARRLGMSRSQLYVNAVRSFLERFQKGRVTEKLNRIYRHETSLLEPGVKKLQARSLPRESW